MRISCVHAGVDPGEDPGEDPGGVPLLKEPFLLEIL